MKSLNFEEVANLINYSRTTIIDLNPLQKEDNKWALYKGVNKVPNFDYPFHLLYLYSDFTKESAIKAARVIRNFPSTIVIYSPSIKIAYIEELKKHLHSKISVIQDLRSYLVAFIQSQVKNYSDKLKELEPRDFVDPHYETPSGIKNKIPNPILSFLTDETDDLNDGAVGVLLAEPGQGKTYTTRYITSRLISSVKYIPIYIHSPQWINILEDDLSSIWKTIAYSFRYFDSPIDWIEGHEEEFVNISLKLGLFRIIFDGFDEYILWNKGKVNAYDVIKTLHELCVHTSSRILITSRTTFWESNLVNDQDFLKLYKYQIKPFDQNHAHNYFSKKLEGNEKAQIQALQIFGQLKRLSTSEDSSNFAGRGFILNLIADLCSREGSSIFEGDSSIVQWIIQALCNREEIRQKLPMSAARQLVFLRELAEYKAFGNKLSSEYLSFLLSCINLSKPDIQILVGNSTSVGKLKDHPLIEKDIIKDEWCFKHEQIEFNLLAEQLLSYIETKKQTSINSFVNNIKMSGSILNDLSDAICDQLVVKQDKEIIIEKLSVLNNCLVHSKNDNISLPHQIHCGLFIASLVTLNIINRYYGGSSKECRTSILKKCFNEDSLSYLQFSDTVSSFDFSDTTFTSCRFDNVVFTNCVFNENTKFKNCLFTGGNIIRCENFGQADFEESCEYDKEAETIFSAERIRYGNKKYSKTDLIRDIDLFIKKFVPKEGVFKTVSKDHILRGPIGVSIHKEDVLFAMEKHVIDEHTISHGSGKAYNVKSEAKHSIQNYLTNGVITDELAKVYNEVLKKLHLE